MTGTKILVPFNFAAYDKKVFDYISKTYAGRDDIQITLFSTYTPPPEVDMTKSPELVDKLKSGISYMSQEKSKKEAGLKQARQTLVSHGFDPAQVDYIYKKKEKPLADEIVTIISAKYYDVLVLSLQGSKTAQLFSRGIHNRVLSTLQSITVSIVK